MRSSCQWWPLCLIQPLILGELSSPKSLTHHGYLSPASPKGAKTGSNEGASRSLSVVWRELTVQNGPKNPSFSSENKAERQQVVLSCMKMCSFEWFNRDSLHRMLPRHTLPTPTKNHMALEMRPGPIMFKTSSSSDAFSQGLTACFWSRTSKILRIEDSRWSTKPRSCFSTKPWKLCFLGGLTWSTDVQISMVQIPHAADAMWFSGRFNSSVLLQTLHVVDVRETFHE